MASPQHLSNTSTEGLAHFPVLPLLLPTQVSPPLPTVLCPVCDHAVKHTLLHTFPSYTHSPSTPHTPLCASFQATSLRASQRPKQSLHHHLPPFPAAAHTWLHVRTARHPRSLLPQVPSQSLSPLSALLCTLCSVLMALLPCVYPFP